jgi:hypothetical protein
MYMYNGHRCSEVMLLFTINSFSDVRTPEHITNTYLHNCISTGEAATNE